MSHPSLTPSPSESLDAPAFTLPDNAVDSHFHVFGAPDRYPFHPNSKYVSERSSPREYFALQAALGLTRGVLVSGGAYGSDYRFMADTLRAHGDRLRGVALLSDTVKDGELTALDGLGVRGVRFASLAHGGVMPEFSRTLAHRVADLGWHVQFYPHATDFLDFAPRLLDLPNTIVLDHFASVPAAAGTRHPAFSQLLKLLDTGRVWVKLSGPMRCSQGEPPYTDVTPMARALVAHAPERVVWGSDWPHVNMHGRTMPNDGALLNQLLEWIPDADQRNRVLTDNPATLYRF